MADAIVIDQKDTVEIRRDRKGEYYIGEIRLHDKDTANLLKRANELLGQLRMGRAPFIKSEPCAPQYEFVCQVCGAKAAGFEEQPDTIRFACNSEKCGGYVRTWVKHKKG
jgi:hypothetical protein